MTAEDIIYELYRYFQVNNNIDLAEKLKISQQTISNWKSRNSLSAIKKKCRELGIYSEIFSDINSNVNNQTITDNHGNLSQTGNIHSLDEKKENSLNIDEAVFAMFKRAYNKCLDKNDEIIEDKIDELIAHLMKFK
ncbi:hypothetical protein CPU12_05730 [Malaciobacter molluscorum LMG 25693]|uniref:Bacteriophage CI repressor N-terminal domain-containing protein n=1 Tax=Malaciobacter molluscorum LMG 25693 TaxID=870501 RepID=A0A2G1DJ19_9BACT|nr:helix-turn-helix domain-containing protein [Malaciobacter molluscorum]AXX93236.1 hypothetical protein AMOL_2284 [Malaciobacter molluscorum LMG 25693]PHO18492.1 hypothetical protein CPU12_05730 [Malaciobacter molluscorum LMG 25693]